MKIRVVNPAVWMLTSVDEGRRQLARCAFAAGLSRGRLDAYVVNTPGSHQFVEGVPAELDQHPDDGVPPFADAEALISRLLAIKPYPHETVIEHSAVSFLFRMSRIASHEAVRHRLTAITQQSTRYCESGKDGLVTFIRPLDRPDEDCGEYDVEDHATYGNCPQWAEHAADSVRGYQAELKAGRKREYARYLLPHHIEVWLQMTANFREWRHIIRLRTSKAAAPEMRLLFSQVCGHLASISPVLVEGL